MAEITMTNTHTNKYISQVQLPGSTEIYEIHDAKAIHEIADLGLSAALKFVGTVDTKEELDAITGQDGWVYLVKEENLEYVWISDREGANKWEPLGNVHDAASSTHIHTGTVTVTGTNKESAVTGTTTIPTISVGSEDRAGTVGGGVLSKETGKAITSVSVASVTHAETKKHIKGTAVGGTVKTTSKDVVSGVTTTPGTFLNKAEQTPATVVNTVTPEKANALTGITTETASAITGFGAHTTADAITGLKTTTINSTVATTATIPNVTSAGSASTFTFTVNDNGVLNISGTNSVAPTLGTAIPASSLVTTTTPIVATGEASGTAKAITELGTTTRADAITTITPTSAQFVNSVAVGTEDVVGTLVTDTGAAVTAVNPATISVLDSAAIDKQPTITLEALENPEAGTVQLVDGLGEAKVTLSTESGDFINAASISPVTVTTPVTTVSTGTTTAQVTGTAAAQEWTMTDGSLTTGQPQG